MDIDRYLLLNQPGWDRLAELSGRARWKRSSLSAAEIDELTAELVAMAWPGDPG